MTNNIAGLWPYVSVQVGVAYLWWGLTWLVVAWYYVGAGKRQWRAIRPEAKSTGLGIWAYGVLMMTLAGLLRASQGKFSTPYKPSEMTHTLSMTLQQGIVCSALCSAMLGLTFAPIDRSHYTPAMFVLSLLGVLFSTVGAVIHLFPPMRERSIVLWRVMMLVSWLGLPLSYLVGLLIYVA